jgi:threonyl-tRNA synthetase
MWERIMLLRDDMMADLREKANDAESESKAMAEENKVISTWYILDIDGKLTPVDEFTFQTDSNLKKFADYEIKKTRAYNQEPEHIKLMRRLQLVDYEPGSDSGNMRYYPNGRLMKSLLESYVTEKTIQYGAVEVETPIMYDYSHPALKDYLARFPARHYVVHSDDKDLFLRFSACFGQFLIMHDAIMSYKQLPLKMYELTRYSFRREKSGEVVGLKRLRAFTMPDMHTVCNGVEQAKDEFGKQFGFCQLMLASVGIEESEYEAAIRMTEEFWSKNKEFVADLIKNKLKKPALIEMWNFRYAYFDPKFEFNVVDSMNKATALSTVQIDHENSKRYGITYVDSQGKKENATILHCSPSGAVERVIYALLELAAIRQGKGQIPKLPLWLSPTQVRFVPVSDKHVEQCVKFAEEMKQKGVRADVDDSETTMDKKIRGAEQEWVPYICVIGDRETQSGLLMTRIREDKKQEKIMFADLAKTILNKTEGMPRTSLSLPMLISKRPIFFG